MNRFMFNIIKGPKIVKGVLIDTDKNIEIYRITNEEKKGELFRELRVLKDMVNYIGNKDITTVSIRGMSPMLKCLQSNDCKFSFAIDLVCSISKAFKNGLLEIDNKSILKISKENGKFFRVTWLGESIMYGYIRTDTIEGVVENMESLLGLPVLAMNICLGGDLNHYGDLNLGSDSSRNIIGNCTYLNRGTV